MNFPRTTFYPDHNEKINKQRVSVEYMLHKLNLGEHKPAVVASWSQLWYTFYENVNQVPNVLPFKIPNPRVQIQILKRPPPLVDDGVRDVQVVYYEFLLIQFNFSRSISKLSKLIFANLPVQVVRFTGCSAAKKKSLNP